MGLCARAPMNSLLYSGNNADEVRGAERLCLLFV